jgi:hypothetical protein
MGERAIVAVQAYVSLTFDKENCVSTCKPRSLMVPADTEKDTIGQTNEKGIPLSHFLWYISLLKL